MRRGPHRHSGVGRRGRGRRRRPASDATGQEVPALPDASQWWYLRNLGIVAAVSVVLLYVALRIFGRLEDGFAENI